MRIGVIGAGEITRNVHLPVLGSIPNVTVAWLYDRNPMRARQVASAYGHPTASASEPADLPAVDAVLLAIPVEFRGPYLDDLARRRIPALCEKPFATSSEEHRNILARFQAHSLGCGYMRRFYQSTRSLRWILDQGWFGPLLGVKYSEGGRSRGGGVDGSFLDDPALGKSRGVLMDLGSHGLDTILTLLRPESFTIHDSVLTLDGVIDRKVRATLEMRGADGDAPVRIEFCVSWLDHQSNVIELHFRDAVVWCGTGSDSDIYVGEPGATSRSARLTAPVVGARNPNQAFFMEWEAFLQGTINGQPSAVSAASALATTELAETIDAFGRRSHD